MSASADIPGRHQSPAHHHEVLAGPLHRVAPAASSRRPVVEDSRTDRTAPLESPPPRGYACVVGEVAVACVLWVVHRAGVRGGG